MQFKLRASQAAVSRSCYRTVYSHREQRNGTSATARHCVAVTHRRQFLGPLRWTFPNAEERCAMSGSDFFSWRHIYFFLNGSIINRVQTSYNIWWLFHSSGNTKKSFPLDWGKPKQKHTASGLAPSVLQAGRHLIQTRRNPNTRCLFSLCVSARMWMPKLLSH